MGNNKKNIRYRTRFGVTIPPFKEEKRPATCHTIEFILHGVVPSKKSHLVPFARRQKALDYLTQKANGRAYISLNEAKIAIKMVKASLAPPKKYETGLKWMLPALLEQKKYWEDRLGEKGLIFPLEKASLTLKLYFNSRAITDTVNKQQTIQDILISAGILKDDNYNNLNPVTTYAACYAEELVTSIASIALTFVL